METCLIITSAEEVCNNPDLLTRILIRLPTRPLLTFKCVSKHWLSLISDPYFCFSHTRYHEIKDFLSPTALLLKWIYSSYFCTIPLNRNSRDPSFDFFSHAPNINVIQSCYGLFLCKSVVEKSPEMVITRYFICNPTTNKFKELSFPENSSISKFYVNMAFDPLKSPHYKVIRVREMADHQPSNHTHTLDVYSSETDSWSVSRISFSVNNNNIVFEDAILCKGKIYWNCSPEESSSLCFDAENESLESFTMPTSTEDLPRERRYIGESRGVLYISVTYLGPYVRHQMFDVFEMTSDCSHLTLKHRLNTRSMSGQFPDIQWDLHQYSLTFRSIAPGFSDICITQFEKDDEPKVVIWMENEVIFFDFNDGAWKSLYKLPKFVTDDPWGESHSWECPSTTQSLHAFQYFENLSSV